MAAPSPLRKEKKRRRNRPSRDVRRRQIQRCYESSVASHHSRLTGEVSSCRTPIRYPRWGVGGGHAGHLQPPSDRRARPSPVVPDSDPVPTVGRRRWARWTSPTPSRQAHPAFPRRAGLRSGTHGGAPEVGTLDISNPLPTGAPGLPPSCRTPIRYPRWGAGGGYAGHLQLQPKTPTATGKED